MNTRVKEFYESQWRMVCIGEFNLNAFGEMSRAVLPIVVFGMSFAIRAQVPDAAIFDRVGWAEEQAFYKQRQDQLLDHIKGAKNIEVAKGWQGVAPWPINWDAQQKFCHRVADALFKEPKRLTFPEPQFSAYRDPAEKLREVLPVPFPNCSHMHKDVELIFKYVKKEFARRKAASDYSLDGSRPRYYVEKNLFIQERRNIELRPPFGAARGNVSVWGQSEDLQKIEMVNYNYEAGQDEKGCPVWGSTVMEDNDWDRAEDSKMILTRIDDEYVFIEIGTFDKDHGVSAAKAKATGGWFSTAGKRYVTATGVHNNLYYTLVPESRREKSFVYGAPLNIKGTMQNWAEPYAYACVINFDGPEASRFDAKPAHTQPRGK